MYVPESAGWNVHIKRDSQKQYCYQKRSGEDFFHLIQAGEIYLVNEAEEKKNPARRLVVQRGGKWQLGPHGLSFLELLTY